MRRRYLYILLFLCHDPIHLSFYFNDTPLFIYRSISRSRPHMIHLFQWHAPIHLSFYFYVTTPPIYHSISMTRPYSFIVLFLGHDPIWSIYRAISMSRPHPFIVLCQWHALIHLSFYYYVTTPSIYRSISMSNITINGWGRVIDIER
jgi:hypothetical protein